MADFMKDESNTWWLVNIKGFVVEHINKIPKLGKSASTILPQKKNTFSE